MARLAITPHLSIGEDELVFRFVLASGPGGQNVNKVASAALLRFDVSGSPSLPEAVKARLTRLAGSRLTREGVLVIDARRFRSQARNRDDAVARLSALIRAAAAAPRRRVATRPTLASAERRLAGKQVRSSVKAARRKPEGD